MHILYANTVLCMALASPLLLLPPHLKPLVWRADQLGLCATSTVPSGFHALDQVLPDGGWPCSAVTEVLQAQPGCGEWRLLGPALRSLVEKKRSVVIVGPPRRPHLPGLIHVGVDASHLLWIEADTPARRLWCTEQVVRSNAAGAVIAWLPHARAEEVRRLQVSAQACEGLVILCRPAAAVHEASAAPLRVTLRTVPDWALAVEIIKRKGPAFEGSVLLPSIPGGLARVLTPRALRAREPLPSTTGDVHALGSVADQHIRSLMLH